MKKYLLIFLSVILISGLIFTSCSSSTTTTTSSKPVATTTSAPATSAPATTTTKAPATTTQTSSGPQSGGDLKILTVPGVTNLGAPGQPGGFNDGPYRQPALEELLTFDPDKLGNVKPFLATAWQWSSDYKSLTLTLRKGVKFHDGTDFNADAAKFSLDLVLTAGMPALSKVSSIDDVDDYTNRLNTKVYDSGLLNSLAYSDTPMVSPTAYKAMGVDATKFHPVGTGPFKFVKYTSDVSLKYERFADYWQKPKPYLNSLEFVFVADNMVMLASFKAGDAQIMRGLPLADAADLQATGKFILNPMLMVQISMIGDSLNPDSVYNNLKVRQAIAYSYDSAVLAKSVGMGFFLPSNQLISPTDPAFNSKVVGYPYNPAKAKQLLTEAGYPNGFDTQITYRQTSYETDLYTLMQGYFKAIGVNLQLKLTDSAGTNDLRRNGWTGLIPFNFPPSASGFEVSYWFRDRLSSAAGYYKCSALIPADYDAKVLSLTSMTDPVAKQAAIDECSKMAIDTYCLLFPMYMETLVTGYSNQVHDCDFFKIYSMNWHSENIWLSK
jgi:peptide/nickel transport system substrate-binding protein